MPARPLELDDNRFFDPNPSVRRAARAVYEETRALPLVCPHGHVDPALLSRNEPFPEPTGLLIVPDHYIFRMLYSQGIPLESLGIPQRDGIPVTTDPRAAWQILGDHWYLFRGTPTGVWLEHELYDVFGIRTKLDSDSAPGIYGEILACLQSPEFLPRSLFERFNIEVLATTDTATDPLAEHRAIRESGWVGRVIPTFRPDAVFRIASPEWKAEIDSLGRIAGADITSYRLFIQTLEERRAFFRSLGAAATDHGVVAPYTERLSDSAVEAIFARGLSGDATVDDQSRFEAHMLMESARMSCDDGMVMQLHPGALRDHNTRILERFGRDKGADIPVTTEYTRNLRNLLETYGNDSRLSLVVFTLDESTYARELAPLAGHYPALRLGPPWWFNDSIEGMMRFRTSVTETAGIYNTAGFNDDTRAFCSIPARHDLSRRVDANWLGGLVARHVIDRHDAREMGRALAYDLVRETYRLADNSARRPVETAA
ncbi:MAG: glucuronate isomerase [Gemmatimonadaceae bacterium]